MRLMLSIAMLVAVGTTGAARELPKPPERMASHLECGWPVPQPGCRAGDLPAPNNQQQFDTLKKLAIDDLTWAQQDAAAKKDTRHKPCWDALLAFINGPDFPGFTPPHLGVASAIQFGFDLAQGPQAIIPISVIDGCAATSFDLRVAFIEFLNRVGMGALLPPFKL